MAEITVTIPKEPLLDTLRTNHQRHMETYSHAVEGYRNKLKDDLAGALSKLIDNKEVTSDIHAMTRLPKPKSYSSEYARVIRMLEMHNGQYVDLAETEFRNFVEDDWSWSGDFIASSSPYTS